MYNIQVKDFGNGNIQIIKYKNFIRSGSLEIDNIDTDMIHNDIYSDNVDLKAFGLRQINDHLIKKDRNIISLPRLPCEMTNEEYKEYLDKLDWKKCHSRMSNDIRDKKKVYDLARSNMWEWFLTFTFSPEKVNDRTDYKECKDKLKKWLNNVSYKYCNGQLKYLIIPEQHKKIESNGKKAWHFHGLLATTGGLIFEDSGICQDGHKIYNLLNFKLGYTTATIVQSTEKISKYITKYMTKSLGVELAGEHRHLCSRNLNKPIVQKFIGTKDDIEMYLNSLEIVWEQEKEFKCKNIENSMHIYECKEIVAE